MKKFERIGHHKKEKLTDVEGKVQIAIRINMGPKGALKGNLTRCITIKNAKVSEVFTAIEKALFGNES